MTTAEAYMQNMQGELGNDLSWSDLKHMPIRSSSSADHGEEEDNDNIRCWTLNSRLDHQEDTHDLGYRISDDAVRSSSPFHSESSSTQCIQPGSNRHATPSPQVKHESSDDEHFTQIPITPSSMYPSSQPRPRYTSLQSPKETNLNTQDTIISSSPAPSSQKRRVNSSFESRGSAASELSGLPVHIERRTGSRKKGRYDASLITNKMAYDEDAGNAYATPHSMFPGTATPIDKMDWGVDDVGGDTDVVVSDEELHAVGSMITHEERMRAPARLITSMGDLTMPDCDDMSGEEEELEGNLGSGSGIDDDEFTDNEDYDDEGEYDVDAWP